MASGAKLLFSKDESRKAFGLNMLPKLKDLRGKLHGLNFPRVRRDSKTSIPVISVIPPTPKSEKTLATQSENTELETTAAAQAERASSGDLIELNNNDDEQKEEPKDTLRIRRVSNQRRNSEPIVLSRDSDVDCTPAPDHTAKDFLKVPRRKVGRRRRSRTMKKSMSADDIVTLKWLATNSMIDHGVAEFCSDEHILEDGNDARRDALVALVEASRSKRQQKSRLASRSSESKSEADLRPSKPADEAAGGARSLSYHSLLYDFDVASSYQIYQPTVYDVDERGVVHRQTARQTGSSENRNSIRFKKAIDQGQVYFDSIVDIIKSKAEHLEIKKTASLPTKPSLALPPSSVYILHK